MFFIISLSRYALALITPNFSGGKARAPTIMTDHDFNIVIGAIRQKNRRTCQVSVSFDTDNMEGFRIKRQVHSILYAFIPIMVLILFDFSCLRVLCPQRARVTRPKSSYMELGYTINLCTLGEFFFSDLCVVR